MDMIMALTTCTDNGVVSDCYKFGVTEDIEERIMRYRTGNPRFKLLFYIPLKIDMYRLESCINSVLKPHEIKSKNETYSFVSLKELKNVIDSCAKIIARHICHCVLCKKTFNFKQIDQHTCSELSELEYMKPTRNSKKSLKKISKTIRQPNKSIVKSSKSKPKKRSTDKSKPISSNRKKKSIKRTVIQK